MGGTPKTWSSGQLSRLCDPHDYASILGGLFMNDRIEKLLEDIRHELHITFGSDIAYTKDLIIESALAYWLGIIRRKDHGGDVED